MKTLMSIVAGAAIFIGLLFLGAAIISENAIQGTHGATVAIALFAFAGLIMFDQRR